MALNRNLILAVAIAGFALCFFSLEVSGLNCFVCNSHDDSRCESDPPAELSIDCATDGSNNTYTACRKIWQLVQKKERVVRQCAGYRTIPSEKCITRVGMKKIKITHCHCSGDDCNAAASLTVGPVLVGLGALLALLQ